MTHLPRATPSTEPDWRVVLCDSLEKVFPTTAPRAFNTALPLVGFQGETVSFQVAVYRSGAIEQAGRTPVRVEVGAHDGMRVRVSSVELVPVELAAPHTPDPHYLRSEPGLFPDLLLPAPDDGILPVRGQWRALWVDLEVSGSAARYTGALPVRVHADGACIAELTVPLVLVGAELPALDLPNTHWFHCDGLADYYGHEVFGAEHWEVIDRQLVAARAISANMILTPVWTPPLDTEIGGYRTPTQLLGITELGPDEYSFDFDGLRRWIALCRAHGFQYLEIPHLFTQWGANATPAIYVQAGGTTQRRFGWDVASTDPRYRSLLSQLIPQLRSVLDAEWGLDRVYFHISDEPTPENLDGYSAARAQVLDLLHGCTIVDAISDVAFYDSGLVPEPIVALDHADAFHAAGGHPWLYYCIAQDTDVSNRFMSLPSTRNRVIGAQLYKFEARGFLHWGFNFYNSVRSVRMIDPFRDPCADRGFIGGDTFLVYPGVDGTPLESIRFRVFAEAMNDLRAMRAVGERHGRDRVLAIIDARGSLALNEYSYDADHYRRVFGELAAALLTDVVE